MQLNRTLCETEPKKEWNTDLLTLNEKNQAHMIIADVLPVADQEHLGYFALIKNENDNNQLVYCAYSNGQYLWISVQDFGSGGLGEFVLGHSSLGMRDNMMVKVVGDALSFSELYDVIVSGDTISFLD